MRKGWSWFGESYRAWVLAGPWEILAMNTFLRTQVAKEDRQQKRSPISILELRFPSIDSWGGIRKELLQGTELGL